MSLERLLPRALGAIVLLAVGGAVAYAVAAASALPDGPVPVVWDKAACAHCRMHVGEPGFAAQLTTTAGATLAFDDPGCLLEYVAAEHPDVHAMWFHHRTDERWLPATAVAFAVTPTSPMGYGLAAVDPGTPGAVDLATARARLAASGANAAAAAKEHR